jgi:hypothetical protein
MKAMKEIWRKRFARTSGNCGRFQRYETDFGGMIRFGTSQHALLGCINEFVNDLFGHEWAGLAKLCNIQTDTIW